jgi:signal transduction histidine kinase
VKPASGSRILVVDDEPSVLETIGAILTSEGYEVVEAGDAAAALAELRGRPFDLVLTDLRMAGVSGVALLTDIQKSWPKTLTIVLTGYASLESAIDALRAGTYDYLVKPCEVEELKATVARALDRMAVGRALDERLAELEAANARIRGFAQELQRQVNEATGQLNVKVQELSEAKQRLEEADRQRGEFISMVVHELNQPLTSITGYAQLLQRSDRDDKGRANALRLIASEAGRLSRLLLDLADASRLQAGMFAIQPAPNDLVDTVRSQVELARAAAMEHQISFEASVASLPAIFDRDRIAQVISNLLTNAILHTGSGAIDVGLRCENGRALVVVKDGGPGIPLEQLDAIFEAGVRLPGQTAPGGSGLGLFIARGIVATHDGRIWAENDPDGGARFLVSLPLRVKESQLEPAG